MKACFIWYLVFTFPNLLLAWGWKDAASLTLERNQTLQAQQNVVEGAKYGVSEAKSGHYPAVNFLGGWMEFIDQRKDIEHKAYIGPRWQWLLYQGGKVSSAVDIASFQEKQAELQREVTSIDIHSRLRQSFANAIYARDSLRLNQEIEKRRQENVLFTEMRYKNGLDFKWVYDSSQVKWEDAKIDTESAKLDQETALKNLESLMGPLPIHSVNDISSEDFYENETQAQPTQVISYLDLHPQILLQKYKLDESVARIRYSKADNYPEVGVQSDTFVGSVKTQTWFPWLTASLLFQIPIFEGFRIQSQTDVAQAHYRQQLNDLAQAKLDLTLKIEDSYRAFVLAKKRLEVSRTNLSVSEDRARVVSKQYRNGLTTFLDWERSQDDWVSAENDVLNNVKTYQISRAKFEEAIGLELVAQ